MKDPRIEKLAHNLVNYSVRLKAGEKVLIEAYDVDYPLITEIVKEVYRLKAYPFVELYNTRVKRELMLGMDETLAKMCCEFDMPRMSHMDAYIGIRGAVNSLENSDVSSAANAAYLKHYSQTVHHDTRVGKTKWVVLRYPTGSMAQAAGMSSDKFEDYYFNVCNLDYCKMDEAMDALKNLMERTDRVRLIAKDTDLTFSIKNIPAIKCAGHMNIPDGEVYTAPVRESVNGVITYNAPSIEAGLKFEKVRLEFKDGKVIDATANFTRKLNEILDTDEGARYVGEFAIGVNPYITEPMGDILFDEKIAGSIHFTPGNSYNDAFNGNVSAVHWDLVLIMTPEYGGGEIWFDDRLIRKDGKFVVPELAALNPENLK